MLDLTRLLRRRICRATVIQRTLNKGLLIYSKELRLLNAQKRKLDDDMVTLRGQQRPVGRLTKTAAGVGAFGTMIASSVASATAQGAGDEPVTPQACSSVSGTHNYEYRRTGGRTYWFPNSSWSTACYGNTLLNPPGNGFSFTPGYGRGYYHAGGGDWKWGSRDNVWIYINDRDHGHIMLSNVAKGTRMNHGYTVRGQFMRGWI